VVLRRDNAFISGIALMVSSVGRMVSIFSSRFGVNMYFSMAYAGTNMNVNRPMSNM